MSVQLFGVQVNLKKLGIFGKREKKENEDKKEVEVKTEEVKKEEKNDENSVTLKEEDKSQIKMKVFDLIKEEYHGFEVNVMMSECDVFADDELHSINISTSNKYISTGEEVCENLQKQIDNEMKIKDDLEREIAELKVKLCEIKAKEDTKPQKPLPVPKKKSGFSFWKK